LSIFAMNAWQVAILLWPLLGCLHEQQLTETEANHILLAAIL
jgi:hypothetical protein